jgi:hypothetical protein
MFKVNNFYFDSLSVSLRVHLTFCWSRNWNPTWRLMSENASFASEWVYLPAWYPSSFITLIWDQRDHFDFPISPSTQRTINALNLFNLYPIMIPFAVAISRRKWSQSLDHSSPAMKNTYHSFWITFSTKHPRFTRAGLGQFFWGSVSICSPCTLISILDSYCLTSIMWWLLLLLPSFSVLYYHHVFPLKLSLNFTY